MTFGRVITGREWLEAAAAQEAAGAAITALTLATRLRCTCAIARAAVARMLRGGDLVGPTWARRLGPRGRAELGTSVLVYFAAHLGPESPDSDVDDLMEIAARVTENLRDSAAKGVRVPVAPLLPPRIILRRAATGIIAAHDTLAAFARRADLVVAVTWLSESDVLTARADIVIAERAGVPVLVVTDGDPAGAILTACGRRP